LEFYLLKNGVYMAFAAKAGAPESVVQYSTAATHVVERAEDNRNSSW